MDNNNIALEYTANLQPYKKALPEGPWHNEPDYEEFEYSGYRCVIIRQTNGSLCGYVEVPRGIITFDVDELYVHGSVTYQEYHLPIEEEYSSSYEYIGFDCNHSMDLSPGPREFHTGLRNNMEREPILSKLGRNIKNVGTPIAYRSIDFVREELKCLVQGIIDKVAEKDESIAKKAVVEASKDQQ